jgi:hypothetical protein
MALGWGAWTLDRPSLPPSLNAASTAEAAPPSTLTKVVATLKGAPGPATAPTTAPMATLATTLATTPPPALSPVQLPVRSANADPVALWVKPEAQQASGVESGATAEAATAVPPRAAASVSPRAARPAPRDRQRTARPKPPTAIAAAKVSHPAKNACDGSGLLANAWCALNPCKASRGRANPECIERLRAEAARQQRIERQ